MCDHSHQLESIEPITEGWDTETSNKIRYFNAAKVQCKSCGKEFRGIQYKDKASNVAYMDWRIINKMKCKHTSFIVDENTKTAKSDDNLTGTIINLVSSPRKLQRQQSLVAKARCTKCHKRLDVKLNINNIASGTEWTLV